ncbi:capsid decoration protein [Gordonia phage Adgers]|uniref:Capsid decoration protein n=8 Tax=Montyvirus TaxID=2733196 RepID=A0A2L1IVC3_9CAUD|nr:head decoration [Gordonia phage Hotorobo]YP_009795595.1 head decoration [Gordonia phage BirksAndSocks]YP_009797858.1 head decoration [Gordonia phage Flakey]YP_009836983.1 head decoration [Gordonia phage Adgers]YP_009848296.1 head decoration [Gordonia phage Beaver]YP_009856302.1 head decoration [Gordonia phage John316]QAY16839.1 capsid decoration protein [Gordonia phage Exiguo]QDF17861.1 capsid decoration protein [Gordonia phage Gorko]QIQ62720.1 capsid decoration protein [Gordonia phage B
MADFVKGREEYAVHGKRQILRHAHPGSFTVVSKTISHEAFPVAEDADGNPDYVLQEGEVLVNLTSGPHAGKCVPFQLDPTTPFTDGRSTTANLVGVCKDYFGWELSERDVEAGVLDRGHLVQNWCTIRDADGNRVTLTNTVADALRSKKNLDILFS